MAAAPPADVAIERELVGLRRKRSRTYLLRDGRRLTKLFPGPLNVRGSDGTWRPLDTDLVSDGAGSFEPTRVDYELALPAALSEVEAGARDAIVRFALKGAAPAEGRVNGPSTRYEEALPGVDVEYEALPSAVKENLVLKRRDAPAEYVFSLDRGGLRAVTRGDGSIDLLDGSGTVAVSIAAPWMRDAAGEVSRAVSQELRSLPTGDELVVTPDASWLDAPERKFPVEVDPTMYFFPGPREDCYIDAGAPAVSNCLSDRLELGWNGDHDHRTLLRFDLAGEVPDGVNLDDAYFGLFMEAKANGENRPVAVYPITRDWTSAVTWNSFDGQTAWTTPGGDFDTTFTSYVKHFGWDPINIWYYWPITELTQAWVDGDFPNYGFVVKDLHDHETSNLVQFASSEDADPNRRPYLGVAWTTAPRVTASGPLYDARGTFLHGDGPVAVRVEAHGVYGVKDVGIEVGGTERDQRSAPCSPGCPNTFAADLSVDRGSLPEGRLDAQGTATSPDDDRDSTPPWEVGIDRSAPTLDFSGSTLNQGGEPLDGDSYSSNQGHRRLGRPAGRRALGREARSRC